MIRRTPRQTSKLTTRSAARTATIVTLAIASIGGMPRMTQAAPQCDGWQPAEILPRQGHAMAFDSNRGVTVMFGGSTLISTGMHANDETWELSSDGSSDWVRRDVAGPSARAGAAMCFDETRDVVVLFGGSTASGPSGETWEYDGDTWQLRTSGGPPARDGAKMVFDSARNTCVLHGGRNTAVLDDTWEWDGRGWTLRTSVGGTGGRFGHGMAYDSARQVTVTYGGYGPGSGNFLSSTWEYDGVQWLFRDAQSAPSNAALAMAYDAVHQRVVRWGGDPFGGIAVWDGTSWGPAQIIFNAPPGAFLGGRMNGGLVHDSVRGVLVFFGGFDGNVGAWGDTWEWSGEGAATWRNPSVHGVDDEDMAIYDSARHVLAVYKDQQMWEYNNTSQSWTRQPAPGLPERDGAVMVYDSAREVYVVFGGRIGVGAGLPTNETWEWNPATATWTFKSNTGPSSRFGHAMAFDSVRNRTVLFGGRNENPTLFQGTWEWDGVAWNPRSETGPARVFHDMDFDPVRNRTILFGGGNLNMTALNDTWEWNGATGQWSNASATNPPSPRLQHQIVYHAASETLLMFGGSSNTVGYMGDVWAYDVGTHAWSQLQPDGDITARFMHAMVYDVDQDRAVVLGGWSQWGKANDHWELCAFALCPADIAPSGGDGQVNINDLLAVINSWGPCPAPPASCGADISPSGGDGQVNINDLLLVINSWGGCP